MELSLRQFKTQLFVAAWLRHLMTTVFFPVLDINIFTYVRTVYTDVCGTVIWLREQPRPSRRFTVCLLAQEVDPWCCRTDALEGFLLTRRRTSVGQLRRMSSPKRSCQVWRHILCHHAIDWTWPVIAAFTVESGVGDSVVEHQSLIGELSLVCTGPAADG